MTDTTTTLTPEQLTTIETLIDPAIAFCEQQSFPLGAAMIRHLWRDGSSDDVFTALISYRNDDGGFGNNLEADIKSSASNAFAARIAMHALLAVRTAIDPALLGTLATWLQANQNPDGDWHFAPAIYDAPLPPWFAAWTFPGLNPAGCVAGLANRLDIATPTMLARVDGLFSALGSPSKAEKGDFYEVLPYVEYFGGVEHPDRDNWLDAIAGGIVKAAARNDSDAGHFFDQAFGGGPELARRIPSDLIATQAERLLGEVETDGGWPSPYDPAWRPHVTMGAFVTFARLRDGWIG